MKMIQVILILTLGIGFYAYFAYLKSSARNRILMIFMGLLGVVFIVFPDFLSQIAAAVGVGRGADLLFYFALLFGFFMLLVLYSKIAKLERDQTELARKISLDLARKPEKK